jgi:hypothetical protein
MSLFIIDPFYYSEEAKRGLEHNIKREKAKVLNIECDKNILEQIMMLNWK